jgi:outer membrane biosynthesis protein TonB
MKASHFLLGLLVVPALVSACASAPQPKAASDEAPAVAEAPPPSPTSIAETPAATVASAEADDPAAPKCTVRCEGVQMATVKGGSFAVADADSKTKAESENANAVLNEKNDDLVRCYKAVARVSPGTQGTVTFDVMIGADGKVVKVDPFGGEKLGAVKTCMMKVIQGAEFAPPHGGGTITIRVPFTLKVQSPDEST